MKKYSSIVSIISLVLLFQTSASSSQKIIGHMEPLKEELLATPITLPNCPGVKIIEWRETVGYINSTKISNQTIEIIDRACNLATIKFPEFIAKNNININNNFPFSFSVCLMPFAEDRRGTNYRNLNDIDYRFFERTKHYDSDGMVYSIYGFTQHFSNNIYMRNDVLTDNLNENKEFVKTFVHEMFHAFSWKYGIYNSHLGDKNLADEKLARAFTAYLGFGL